MNEKGNSEVRFLTLLELWVMQIAFGKKPLKMLDLDLKFLSVT